jgi:hypothetical protein
MKIEKTNPENGIQLSNVPLMYADSVVGLAIGPFVSKIILGVENPDQKSVPSLQISMPTNALHSLATSVIEILRDPDAQAKIAQGHAEYQKAIAEAK